MRFLVAVHHPNDFDASVEDAATHKAIDDLNDEMVAAGIRLFVGGLYEPARSRAVTAGSDGEVLVTDGPYLETKEHLAGFWVLELPSMEEATEWARKAVVACRANIEVRQFH